MYKNRIREIRNKKGLTLEHVANVANISVGYLCHLEKGTRSNPSAQIMERIASIFFN